MVPLCFAGGAEVTKTILSQRRLNRDSCPDVAVVERVVLAPSAAGVDDGGKSGLICL